MTEVPRTLPRIFPPWVDRLQIKYMNPVIKPLAGRLPGLSKLTHRGRRSGRTYQTVVTAFRRGDQLAIALGHGKTDWVQNVLAAGEADIEMSRQQLHLVNPRIVPSGRDVPTMPRLARLQARNVAVLVADVS